MRHYKSVLLVIALTIFVGLGVNNVVRTHNLLKFKDIQLKSTSTDLINLQLKYDLLNKNLQKELESGSRNEQKIKQLEEQKKQLESEKQKLQQDLQARADRKNAEKQKLAQTASMSATAYATSDAKMFIYMHESHNKPTAINPQSGACGLGQALPCSKMLCSLTDYACQDAFFTDYMKQRYGSWEAAQAFWVANEWW